MDSHPHLCQKPQNYQPKYPGIRANQLLIPDLSGMTAEQRDRRADAEALWFLKKYFPAALESLIPVPIRLIAEEKLHLTIFTDKKLADHLDILGEVVFSARRLTVINEESGEEETAVFPRGSLLIDRDVFWERGLGSFHFTLAHEIYHWLRHRVHIAFMQFAAIPDDYAKAKEIMEIQANRFASLILMPARAVKAYYADIIGNDTDDESREMAVSQCARYFQISKTAMKYRLNHLGVYDNIASPTFRRRIDQGELFELYLTDDLLRDLLENNIYRYFDGYVVKNDSLYVERELKSAFLEYPDTEYILSDYALQHLEECTLSFCQTSKRLVSEAAENVLHKAGAYSLTMDYNIRMKLTKDGERIEDAKKAAGHKVSEQELSMIQKQRQQTEQLRTKYHDSFDDYLSHIDKWPSFCEHILPIIMRKNEQFMTLDILDDNDDAIQEAQGRKKQKVGSVGIKKPDTGYLTRYFWHEDFPTGKRLRIPETEVFQARTLVSYKIFEQIRSNRWKNPSLEMIIAICAGYNLTIREVREALKYAGYLLIYLRTHLVYRFLFTVCRNQFHDTDTFNTLLMFLGEKPLGSKAGDHKSNSDKGANE